MDLRTSLASWLETSIFDPCDARLVLAVARAGGSVLDALKRFGFSPEANATGSLKNVRGQSVSPVSALANDAFITELSKEACCGGLSSAEMRTPLDFRSHGPDRFVCFSPLEGAPNLESQGPVGSLFWIGPWLGSAAESALTCGKELLAAGYFSYSTTTTLVLASSKRVCSFVWSEETLEFELSEPDLRCPVRGASYSFDSELTGWYPSTRDWLARLSSGELLNGRSYSERNTGSLVADAHRTLIEGGVMAYPAERHRDRGRLRLAYEVNPLAFVFRAASGRVTSGGSSPLDIAPRDYDEHCPLVLGSRDEVETFERWHDQPAGLTRRPA